MKLLIFSPYYPPHIGGLESHADEFNKYLSQRGMDITVFTPRLPLDSPEIETKFKQEFRGVYPVKSGEASPARQEFRGVYPVKSGEASPARQEFNRVKIIRFPAFEIIPNYPLPKFWSIKFWKLFFSLFKQDFDLTISRTRFFVTSLMALVYAKIKKTRWIHIEHGSDFVQLSSKFKSLVAKIYDYTFGWLVFKRSDLNISISQAVQKFVYKFDKRYSPIIQRGIDITKIISIKKNKIFQQKYPNKIIIGFVGRLIDGKGVVDLITALHNNNIKSTNFICLIIGDGPRRKKINSLIKKYNLQNKIFLLGEKKHSDAIALMKSFDIFVNPSYTEGLPTSVLEATICKNAIIATDVGGTNKIIQHNENGYLIQPKDIKNLRKYLITLINDPVKIKELGEKAYQHTQKTFSWEKSIQKYETEFKKILARK